MDDDLRTAVEGLATRLRAAIDTEIESLTPALAKAAEAAEQRARKAADADSAAREAAIRIEAESRLRQRLDEVRAEAESHLNQRIADTRAEAVAEARASTAREQLDAASARVSEREARLAAVERLLASVRRIDAAGTLRETLEVLVQSASLETPRVAMLLIEGDSVRAFSHRGFSDVPQSGPIAPGGVVEACVRHGQAAFTGDAAGLRAPGFAALADDRAGFAVPLRVGNRTVAVLYADDAGEGERDAPAAWPEALELLARHTSLHLENLTAVRARYGGSPPVQPGAVSTAGVEGEIGEEAARRYARLLLSEIKLYNEGDVRLGREHRDLRQRLRSEIDRAARAYRDRIPETLAAREQYFEAELVNTLADGDPSVL